MYVCCISLSRKFFLLPLQSFDELLLLKPGGECIYWGPLGKEGAALITYFSRIPGVDPIKPR